LDENKDGNEVEVDVEVEKYPNGIVPNAIGDARTNDNTKLLMNNNNQGE
jgi:hypothetical protein